MLRLLKLINLKHNIAHYTTNYSHIIDFSYFTNDINYREMQRFTEHND